MEGALDQPLLEKEEVCMTAQFGDQVVGDATAGNLPLHDAVILRHGEPPDAATDHPRAEQHHEGGWRRGRGRASGDPMKAGTARGEREEKEGCLARPVALEDEGRMVGDGMNSAQASPFDERPVEPDEVVQFGLREIHGGGFDLFFGQVARIAGGGVDHRPTERVSYALPERGRGKYLPARMRTTVSKQTSGAVIHRNVAVIACDTAATLAETSKKISELGLDIVMIGDRHIVIPARYIPMVLGRFKELGQFPRLLGEPLFDHVDEGADGEISSTENG